MKDFDNNVFWNRTNEAAINAIAHRCCLDVTVFTNNLRLLGRNPEAVLKVCEPVCRVTSRIAELSSAREQEVRLVRLKCVLLQLSLQEEALSIVCHNLYNLLNRICSSLALSPEEIELLEQDRLRRLDKLNGNTPQS